MQRRNVLIMSVVVLLVAGGAGFAVLVTADDKEAGNTLVESAVQGESMVALRTFVDEEQGVLFQYNPSLRVAALGTQDTDDNFIARLESQEPPVHVSVRYEQGIRTISTLANTVPERLLEANASKALPARYPGYTLVSEESESVGGKASFEKVFTYTGPSGDVAKQRLLVIMKDDNTAVYVSMQTTENAYATVDQDFFGPIIESLQFQ